MKKRSDWLGVETGTRLVFSGYYNLACDMTEALDADGRATLFSYNALGSEAGETWYSDASDASSGTDPLGKYAFAYDVLGDTTGADNQAAAYAGASLETVADYADAYTITGNLQTEKTTLGAMTQTVTLAMDYDYNNDMTTLAANIGDGTANFNSSTGAFESFTGGTNDFKNTYTYDTLGDTTGITQTGNGGNTVTDKNVTLNYDDNQELDGWEMYQSSGTSDLVASVNYACNGDWDLTDLDYYTNTDDTGTPLAGYHWDYNTAGAVSDEYSRNDSSAATPDEYYESGTSDWAETSYTYDADAELTGAAYTYFAGPPTGAASQQYDANGNALANYSAPAAAADAPPSDATIITVTDPAGSGGTPAT